MRRGALISRLATPNNSWMISRLLENRAEEVRHHE
jgi:hypothetical protein